MKKTITFTTVLLLSAFLLSSEKALAKDELWESLIGCYEALERNGVPVKPYAGSEIHMRDYGYYIDAGGVAIPNIEIIFVYLIPDGIHYSLLYFYPTLGKNWEDTAGIHFHFTGKLTGLDGQINNMRVEYDFQILSNELIKLHAVSQKEGSPPSVNDFTAKKVECSKK
jgi:hypothetical protein